VPGAPSAWTYAGKKGFGTSYEAYVDKQYRDGGPTGTVSKVWFSIARGIVTETASGLIHEAQIKDLQLLVKGNGFFDEEKIATDSTVSYLHADRAAHCRSHTVSSTRTGKASTRLRSTSSPTRIGRRCSCGSFSRLMSPVSPPTYS
jgi:glucoamylase